MNAGCSRHATAPPSKSSRPGVNLGASCRFFATICATSYAALAALIEEGHTDEALKRIDELCEAGDRTAVRRFCANETVNIALSSFGSDISKRGISADLRARRAPERACGRCRPVQRAFECPGKRHWPRRAPPPRASALSILICGLRTGSCCFRFPTHLDGAAHGRRHARGSARRSRLWHQEH